MFDDPKGFFLLGVGFARVVAKIFLISSSHSSCWPMTEYVDGFPKKMLTLKN